MKHRFLAIPLATFTLILGISSTALAQPQNPIKIIVDATDAPRKVLHSHMTIPVQAGTAYLGLPQVDTGGTWADGAHR